MDYRHMKVELNPGSLPHYTPSVTAYGDRCPGYNMTPVEYPWYNGHRPSDINFKWGPDPYGYYRFKLWQQACAISQRQTALRHAFTGPRLGNVPHGYPLTYQYQYPTRTAHYPVHAIPANNKSTQDPLLSCPIKGQGDTPTVMMPPENHTNHQLKCGSIKELDNLHKGSSLSGSRQAASQLPNPSLFRPYSNSTQPMQIPDVTNLNTSNKKASSHDIHNPRNGTVGESIHLQTDLLGSHEYNSRDILHMTDYEGLGLNPGNVQMDPYQTIDSSGELTKTQVQLELPMSLKSVEINDKVASSVNEHQNGWNGIYQNPVKPRFHKPASTPVFELMTSIMQGRGPSTPKGLTNDLLDFAPALALDLLEEECASRFRDHQTASANIDLKGLKGDRDLEELIMMDTELDQILESIVKQDTEETCAKPKTIVKRRKRTKIKHVCEICGKNFSCRANRIVHMRIHSGEKPYECEYCGKRFKQRSTMSTHIRIHTGDKPYVCDQCDRAFSDYSSWRKHIRLHSGEKPFRCSVCNKGFVQSGNRDRHMKRHVMISKKIPKKSR